jgi:hypothetical protein
MRPQFHHLDAYADLDKNRTGSKNPLPTRPPEARAVHMTVKNPVDGEEDSKHNMADRISETQQETWRRYKYYDEDSAQSWNAYRHLFVGVGLETGEELKQKMPKLKSAWTDDEYLDEISAPLDAARLSRAKMDRTGSKSKVKGNNNMAGDGDMEDGSGSSSDESLAAEAGSTNDLYDG